MGPSHYLVLNKFAVVPEHFILATTEFKPQTHVLEESDLASTLACIEAYEDARLRSNQSGKGGNAQDGLYAFFNCGEHSGASQPHRHIQLLPISRMKDGLDDAGSWSILADNLKTHKPPFVTFSEDIRLDMPGSELHAAYLRLYRRACRAVALNDNHPPEEDPPTEGETVISYNMAMTKSTLVLAPRIAEGAKILSPQGQHVGSLALNGTVLAGTALVKNELEWEALRQEPASLLSVLRGIGVPSDKVDADAIKP